MRRRNGFALLTALWLLLLMGVLFSRALPRVVTSLDAAENRVLLTRAKWAAIGCLELARARGESEAELPDSVALGSGVWCRPERLDPDERINPNLGDSVGLHRALQDPSLTASLLDWIDADDVARDAGAEAEWYRERGRPVPRNAPFMDPREMRLVRGFEGASAADLESWFTTRGDGRVSGNRASRRALASIGVMAPEDVEAVLSRRFPGRSLRSAEQFVLVGEMQPTIEEYQQLTARLSFDESTHTIRFHGLADAGARTLDYAIVAVIRNTPRGSVVSSLEAQ
jgi:type II secretory pathway component PulK